MNMEQFFSCDWGTSSFRLRLVQAESQTVLHEVTTAQGIASIHKLWQSDDQKTDRLAFYRSVIESNMLTIKQSVEHSLVHVPVIISGMASASIGMMELPYKDLPFSTRGTDLLVTTVEPTLDFPHPLVVISGVTTGKDVLRGEETLLVGCNVAKTTTDQLFIFPGTHSKHIRVKNGNARDFKTYMTGELFDLLANKSILSGAVEKDPVPFPLTGNTAFDEGIHEGVEANLLNSFFNIRINQLFNKRKPKDNYHYLSGLLIGAELKSVADRPYTAITLVCDTQMRNRYYRGMELLGLHHNLVYKNSDETIINGQLIICS
jgi:2-dehydro-3-deoxygalactonokinase